MIRALCICLLLWLACPVTCWPQQHHLHHGLGLSGDDVTCLCKDHNGFLWIGTSQGLNRFDGSNVTTYFRHSADKGSLLNNKINGICEDTSGNLYIATAAGLSVLNLRTAKFINFRDIDAGSNRLSLSAGVAFVVYFEGRIYAGIGSGLLEAGPLMTGAQLHDWGTIKPGGQGVEWTNNGASVSRSGLWMLTSSGLIVKNNSRFLSDGKLTDHLQIDDDISAVCSSGDTQYYCCPSSFPGVIVYNSRTGVPKKLGFKELNDERIISVCCQPPGKIWLATSARLYLINEVAHTLTACQVGGAPGLRISQLMCDEIGTLFIATSSGLYFGSYADQASGNDTNAWQAITDPFVPRVAITGIKKAGIETPLPAVGNLDVSYKDKIVSFEFAAADFLDPGHTMYAYTLEGYDCDWNFCEGRTIASYKNLPEGDYVFRVKATTRPGNWNTPGHELGVHVYGPFWKTWWFPALCCLAVGVLVYGAYYLRLRQLIRIQEIRNKISRDLHDDIGSALSSIAIYGEVAKKYSSEKTPEAIPVLNSLQETTKVAMDNMNDIVWSINPGNDKFITTIERLELYANEILNARGIRLHFRIADEVKDEKLSMQHRKNIYLICKEAINNVAKYSEAANCIVEIKKDGRNVSITINDDGKGFCGQATSLGGNGINNMKSRAIELKGILDIFSVSGSGTSLSLKFLL